MRRAPERHVDDEHIGVVEGRAWAKAATALVTRDGASLAGALDRADTLLGELRRRVAWLSDTLYAGLTSAWRASAQRSGSLWRTSPVRRGVMR